MFTRNSEIGVDIATTWENYLYIPQISYAMQQMAAPTSAVRTDYFENLNKKWDEFVLGYEGIYANSSNLDNISFYFYRVAILPDLSELTLYNLLVGYNYNLDETKNTINDLTQNQTGSYSYPYSVLLDMKKNLYNATLDVMNDAKNVGCLTSETFFHSCDTGTLPSYANYQKLLDTYNTEYPKKINAYRNFAFGALINLCIEMFGKNASNSTQGDL